MMKSAFGILCACFLVGLAPTEQQLGDKPTIQKAAATEVSDAYDTNDARADELYGAKVIEVTGEIVGRIEGHGEPGVRQYEVIMAPRGGSMELRFQFDVKERKQLIDLKPELQTITIQAYCEGRTDVKLDGSRSREFVRFKDCKVIAVQFRKQQ